jgi:hypothetical protein
MSAVIFLDRRDEASDDLLSNKSSGHLAKICTPSGVLDNHLHGDGPRRA